MRRVLAAAVIVLACAACDRGEPAATFRELTDPFPDVAAHCWPFVGAAPFTTPWFATSLGSRDDNAAVTVEVLETTSEEVTALIDTWAGGTFEVSPSTGTSVSVKVTAPADQTALLECAP